MAVPDDCEMDGVDQSAFLSGEQETSNHEDLIYWNGPTIHAVKWRNFKMVMAQQKYLSDPALPLNIPHVINLTIDLKERKPFSTYFHTWTAAHFGKLLAAWAQSVAREPLIPAGAPLDFVPTGSTKPVVKKTAATKTLANKTVGKKTSAKRKR